MQQHLIFKQYFCQKKDSVQITEKTFAISSGGMEYVNIVMYNSIFSLIKKIKNLGYWTIGLDMNSSNQIKDLDLKNQNIALIVGSEETGISKEIQKKLDLIVDISMTDNMDSLNASVATAIAMHEIFIKKLDLFNYLFAIILMFAGVAQWPEQPTCNRQVRGSTPLSGSK